MAKSLKLYETELMTLASLPEETAGKILYALVCAETGANVPELATMENAVFTLIRSQTERAKAEAERKRGNRTDKPSEIRYNPQEVDADETSARNCAENSAEIPPTITSTTTSTVTNTTTPTTTSTTTDCAVNGDAEVPAPIGAEAAAVAVASEPVPFVKIQEMFNATVKRIAKIKSIDGNRRKAVSARFKTYGLDAFRTVFEKADASDFLCGGGSRSFTASFDWLMKPDNFLKTLEGNYDNKPVNGYQSPQGQDIRGKSPNSGVAPTQFKPSTGGRSFDDYRKAGSGNDSG